MRTRRTLFTLIVAGILVAGCGTAAVTPVEEEHGPAVVEAVEGSEGLHRITLTAQAAERLGIETADVTAAAGAGARTQLPYSAVIYDAEGAAWAYVADGELTYVRHALTVDEIVADDAGDYAVLASGPEAGRSVVSVGVAELFGAEFEVGH
jgi:hypothetical protein